MRRVIVVIFLMLGFAACANKPKTQVVDTSLDRKSEISESVAVGVKKGEEELVYQRKNNILSELVKLEEEVFQLQDDVYGTPEYNSKGLYGQFLDCRKRLALKTGEMSRIPDKSPVVAADKVSIVIDKATGRPIGYTEESLVKRFERFKSYKSILYERKEEIENLIDKCQGTSSLFYHERVTSGEGPS